MPFEHSSRGTWLSEDFGSSAAGWVQVVKARVSADEKRRALSCRALLAQADGGLWLLLESLRSSHVGQVQDGSAYGGITMEHGLKVPKLGIFIICAWLG